MDPEYEYFNGGMILQNEQQLMYTVESPSPSSTFPDIPYHATNTYEQTPFYPPNPSASNSPQNVYDHQDESTVNMQPQFGNYMTSHTLINEHWESQTHSNYEYQVYYGNDAEVPHNDFPGNRIYTCSHNDSIGSDDSVELPPVDIKSKYHSQQPPYEKYLKDFPNDKNLLPAFSVFAETKKPPNRRGRPVTYNKPGHNFSESDSEDERITVQSRGFRRGAKNILLWKFLLGELRKPSSNHVKWEDERQGIFKFVDTAECSRLWGMMKKKEDMNFEKLSRGIRHYYKDGLMSRRDGIRLVYKFNWDRVPKSHWPKFLH